MKPANKALLLGFGIDSTHKEELPLRLDQLYKAFSNDLKPKFGTTVNALVLGLASGWPFAPRDPEVLRILRKSDFVGLDSPFLSKLASLLGTHIPQISSDDLLLEAVHYAAERGKRVYLIGGDEQICKETAQTLQQDFPGLKIAGYAAPHIYTKGLKLENSIEEDRATIAAIQNANPDILLIQLGHPKQDLWFGRIENQLKIPLALGVGGAFDRYLANHGKKLPSSGGWSWSSLKRKFITFTRFALWSPLLFIYNTLNRLIYDLIYRHRATESPSSKLYLSQNDAMFVIPLPTLLNASKMKEWEERLEEAMEHDHIVLDLQEVRHISLKGLGLLLSIKQRVDNAAKNLFLLGVSADLRWFLKIHGAWDLFSPLVCANANAVIDRITVNHSHNGPHDFVAIEQSDDQTLLGIFGPLNGWEDDSQCLLNLNHLINGKDCAVNLNYCTSISNRGFGFLLQLRRRQAGQHSLLTILNASRSLKKQFKLAKLYRYFDFS